MIPQVVVQVVGAVFSTTVLGPIRLGSALVPADLFWPPLQRVSYHVVAAAARLTRPILSRGVDHPLGAAMRFVDLVEGLVGIEGQWEVLDQESAVRRVHRCPHARALDRTPEFCTRLGVVLGQALAEPLVDHPGVRFEVLATLSQGDPRCEYRLTVKG